jgi:hypothetical protein
VYYLHEHCIYVLFARKFSAAVRCKNVAESFIRKHIYLREDVRTKKFALS